MSNNQSNKDEIKQKQSERLNEIIREAGIQQKELVPALHVSEQTVSHWFTGRRSISVEHAKTFSNYLRSKKGLFYSAGYIMGADDYTNQNDLVELKKALNKSLADLVDNMMELLGYEKESLGIFEHNEKIIEIIEDSSLSAKEKIEKIWSFGHYIPIYEKIRKPDGSHLYIDVDKVEFYFQAELSDYLSFRLEHDSYMYYDTRDNPGFDPGRDFVEIESFPKTGITESIAQVNSESVNWSEYYKERDLQLTLAYIDRDITGSLRDESFYKQQIERLEALNKPGYEGNRAELEKHIRRIKKDFDKQHEITAALKKKRREVLEKWPDVEVHFEGLNGFFF